MSSADSIPRVAVDPSSRVILHFEDGDALRSFFDAAKRDGGFMIPMTTRPRPFATLAFVATDAVVSFELAFQARAVQISERGAELLVAFLLADWNESKDRELERVLTATASAPTPTEEAPSMLGDGLVEEGELWAGDAPADQGAAAEDGELAGASPIFRLKQLDPAKKMLLAMRADRAERQILCRDTQPQVLLGLLSNPRIEAEEVLAIVKSTHASAAIMQRVANDRRWMGSAEIRTAVVRNPKTPAPIAIRLLDTLPITELRDMAKMGSLREDVRRAAFRVYTKMTSGR
jgi:hypothetical protein